MKDKSLDISAIGKIKKVLKEEKPDIVHTHASLSARIATKLYGKCKIIFTKHCDFPISSKYKYKIVRWITKKINNLLTNKIIATSELAKENLVKQGIEEALIETVLNAVDGYNELGKEEKCKIRKKYNLSEEDIVVGYLARIEELKGHKYLIEAAKKIKDMSKEQKELEKYKFLIMGSGSYEETARNLVKELNLEDTVIFTGFIKNVEEMLNIVDIQVNASYLSETTNLALLEGMSLGIPTVATKCGGTSKMITDWENGLLVEKANSEALADGILLITKDKEKFNKMKENSKRIFKEKYTSEKYAKNIERIYENVLK